MKANEITKIGRDRDIDGPGFSPWNRSIVNLASIFSIDFWDY